MKTQQQGRHINNLDPQKAARAARLLGLWYFTEATMCLAKACKARANQDPEWMHEELTRRNASFFFLIFAPS
jgi:hypothetical protein